MNLSLRRHLSPARLSNGEGTTFGVVVAVCALVLAGVVFAAVLSLDTAKDLMNDPSEVDAVDYPAYFGAVSYLGIIAWTVGAALSFFAASIAGARTPAGRFLLSAGALTTLLALDDLFRFHEHVGFLYSRGEHLMLTLYGVLAIAMLWHNRRFVLAATPLTLLLAAGALLFTSAAVDLSPIHPDQAFLLEDGSKFLGIAVWAVYLGIIARRAVAGRSEHARAADGGRESSPPVLIQV